MVALGLGIQNSFTPWNYIGITKTMVSLGMFPKENLCQLKRTLESLEAQNVYLMEVVT